MKPNKIKTFYESFHTDDTTDPLSEYVQTERCDILRRMLKTTTGYVLVIGCGSQDDMSILNPKCQGYGIDLSKEAVKKSKNKYPQFEYQVADAMDLPFPEHMFDCIVCSEVIEHLPDQKKFLNGVKRVLKPNGIFIVTTPNWMSWYGLARFMAEKLTGRPFTSADQPIDNWAVPWKLKQLLLKQGFQIKTFTGFWFYPPTGKGSKQISWKITFPIVKLLYPFEVWFRNHAPWLGHSIIYQTQVVKH